MTEAPGWKRANPETRAQIADACLPSLQGFPPLEEWLDPGKSFYPALAGYRALRYLHDHDNAGLEALGDHSSAAGATAVLSFVGGKVARAASRRPGNQSWHGWPSDVQRRWRRSPARRSSAKPFDGEGHLFVLHRLRGLLETPLGPQLLDLLREVGLRALPEAGLLESAA